MTKIRPRVPVVSKTNLNKALKQGERPKLEIEAPSTRKFSDHKFWRKFLKYVTRPTKEKIIVAIVKMTIFQQSHYLLSLSF